MSPRSADGPARILEHRMTVQDSKTPERVSLRRRFLSLPTLFSFAVAAGVIALLVTRFDLDWAATWDNVRAMDPWTYVAGLAAYYASFVFRGVRWRLLALNAVNGTAEAANVPSALRCSQLIAMGWFVNAITWLRLGDAYRAFAFADDSKRLARHDLHVHAVKGLHDTLIGRVVDL